MNNENDIFNVGFILEPKKRPRRTNAIELANIKFAGKHQNYQKQIRNSFISSKGQGLDWSDYCYIPMAGTIAILTQGNPYPCMTKEIIEDACNMAAFSGWNANKRKIVYIDNEKFNKILRSKYNLDYLAIQRIFDKINYGIYIDGDFEFEKVVGIECLGALVWIEHDVNSNRLELRTNLYRKDKEGFLQYTLHLLDDKSLQECIADTLNFTKKQAEMIDSINYDIEEFEKLDFKNLDKNLKGQAYVLDYIYSIILFIIKNL